MGQSSREKESLILMIFTFRFIFFAQNERTVKFQYTKQAGTARIKALIGDL